VVTAHSFSFRAHACLCYLLTPAVAGMQRFPEVPRLTAKQEEVRGRVHAARDACAEVHGVLEFQAARLTAGMIACWSAAAMVGGWPAACAFPLLPGGLAPVFPCVTNWHRPGSDCRRCKQWWTWPTLQSFTWNGTYSRGTYRWVGVGLVGVERVQD